MKSGRAGFTLIEILIAIFIFAILVTTLFGSFRIIYSSSESLGKDSAQFEMAQSCLARMTADLQSIFVTLPPAYKAPTFNEESDPYRVVGDMSYSSGESFSRLRFTSLEHLPFGENNQEGIAEIIYYVQQTEHDDYVLRRSDRLYPYEEFEEKDTDPILCENIHSFSIRYFDEDGTDDTLWDSESPEYDYATPRAVEIVLDLGVKDAPLVFQTRIHLSVYRQKRE